MDNPALTGFTLPGGRVGLASGSRDKTFRLWDPLSECIGDPLVAQRSGIEALVAVPAPDGGSALLPAGIDTASIALWVGQPPSRRPRPISR